MDEATKAALAALKAGTFVLGRPSLPVDQPTAWQPNNRSLEEIWLASGQTWAGPKFPEHWEGKKIVGQGSFGIVALWQYTGPSTSAPPIKDVAVKSSKRKFYSSGDEAEAEALVHAELSRQRSPHILRLYTYNLDASDPDYEDAIRLYMEYAPAGDLQILTARKPNRGGIGPSWVPAKAIEEADLWDMFYCLVKAIAVMANGTEAESGLSWNREHEIMHNDIKLDNILMGYLDDEHQRFPILKLADFGVVDGKVLKLELQNDSNGAVVGSGRGDIRVRAPEANDLALRQNPLDRPRKGNVSNVYQIGISMYNLLIRPITSDGIEYVPQPQDAAEKTIMKETEAEMGGVSHGWKLGEKEWADMYSKRLRKIIMSCTMREPLLRISWLPLLKAVREGRDVARAIGLPNVSQGNFTRNDNSDLWPDNPAFIMPQKSEPRDPELPVLFPLAPSTPTPGRKPLAEIIPPFRNTNSAQNSTGSTNSIRPSAPEPDTDLSSLRNPKVISNSLGSPSQKKRRKTNPI